MGHPRFNAEDIKRAARGRWPDILSAVGGIDPHTLVDDHGPCPVCGGKDRFRFDDIDGEGTHFCNQCDPKAGDGLALLGKAMPGTKFPEILAAVGQYLGLDPDHGEPATRPAQQPGPRPSGSQKRVAYTPVLPVPADAPAPDFEHFRHGVPSKVWTYRDADGAALCHVARFDTPDMGKQILPRTWCTGSDGSLGWRWVGIKSKRPLYGLEELARRRDQTRSVLLVEGEKTADAARELAPRCIVLSWLGGTPAIAKVDWSPLAGMSVAVWPDADQVGREAITGKVGKRGKFTPGLADLLAGIPARLQVVTPPAGVPEGWDLADAAAAGWTEAEVMKHLAGNIGPAQSARPSLDFDGGEDRKDDGAKDETARDAILRMIRPVGFDDGRFYYLPAKTNQVLRLSAGAHTRHALLGLAPLGFWERNFPGDQGCEWLAAANAMMRLAESAGVFDPDQVRGRGAWWDEGRVVVHLGDRLLVDGKKAAVSEVRTRRIYQSAARLPGPSSDPLDDAAATEILRTAEMIRWERPASAVLLCGWAVLAPICGALAWRPHIWLSGGAGSGKTTVLRDFLVPLLGGIRHHVQGETTEAGVRQTLRSDAIPIVFDEAEQNERRDNDRIQMVLGLMRQASSESGAIVAKGSAGGDARAFKVRSMFCLASIAAGIKQVADKTRISVLGIRSLRPTTTAEKDEIHRTWKLLEARLAEITDDLGRRLIARTVRLIPTLRTNAEVFARVAGREFGSQRIGDQYGHLLAGAFSLTSSQLVQEEQALAYIRRYDWKEYLEPSQDRDELRLLAHIRQHVVMVDGARRPARYPVGELIDRAAIGTAVEFGETPNGEAENLTPEIAERELARLGMQILCDDGGTAEALAISNTAEGVGRILSDTPWANNWSPILRRVERAEPTGVIYFGPAVGSTRAVSVPLDTVRF